MFFIKCSLKFLLKYVMLVQYNRFRNLLKPASKLSEARIAVYTSCFGNYDRLPRFVKQSLKVDWIGFTDQEIEDQRWQIYKQNPCEKLQSSRHISKWYKINSHKLEALKDYDYTIYIDASAVIVNSRFVEEVLQSTDVIGLFNHSERQSLLEEAQACENMAKYKGESLQLYAEQYVKEMGSDNKLYAGGVIVRKGDTSKFNESWWVTTYDTLQDQISLPIALFRSSLEPSLLPGTIFKNVYVMFWTCHRMQEYDKIKK